MVGAIHARASPLWCVSARGDATEASSAKGTSELYIL